MLEIWSFVSEDYDIFHQPVYPHFVQQYHHGTPHRAIPWAGSAAAWSASWGGERSTRKPLGFLLDEPGCGKPGVTKLVPRRLTYSLKIHGWKMKFPFEMVLFWDMLISWGHPFGGSNLMQIYGNFEGNFPLKNDVGVIYLEDHPMTCKWIITMVSKSPKDRVVGCTPSIHGRTLWLMSMGVTSFRSLPTYPSPGGPILQVTTPLLHSRRMESVTKHTFRTNFTAVHHLGKGRTHRP